MKQSLLFSSLLVFVFIVSVLCSVRSVDEQFTLSAPYLIGTGNSAGWNMNGHTMTTDKEIHLTSSTLKNAIGRIWNRQPLRHVEWEINTKFKITAGKNGGNGFAFWLTEKPIDGIGEAFGCPSTWKGLMIAADTYDAKKKRINPRVFGFFNDGTQTYNQSTNGEEISLKSCNVDFRNQKNPVSLNVAFSSLKKQLSVSLEINGSVSPCFVIQNIEIPTNYYVGYSASCPTINADTHDIISVSVLYDNQQKQTQPKQQQNKQTQQTKTAPASTAKAEKGSSNAVKGQSDKQTQTQTQSELSTDFTPPVVNLPPQTTQVVNEELKAIEGAVERMKADVVKTFDSIIASNDRFSQIVSTLATQTPRDYRSELDELTKLLSDLRIVVARIPAAENAAELERITETVGEVRMHLDDVSTSMRSLNNRLHSHTRNTVYAIRIRSSKGFWTFFFIFEIVFLIGVIFWKQLREEKAKVI